MDYKHDPIGGSLHGPSIKRVWYHVQKVSDELSRSSKFRRWQREIGV